QTTIGAAPSSPAEGATRTPATPAMVACRPAWSSVKSRKIAAGRSGPLPRWRCPGLVVAPRLALSEQIGQAPDGLGPELLHQGLDLASSCQGVGAVDGGGQVRVVGPVGSQALHAGLVGPERVGGHAQAVGGLNGLGPVGRADLGVLGQN